MLIALCFLIIVLLCFVVWKNEIWMQMLAVILSALLGAFVVTLTTKKSLREEKEREEWKDKSVKIYENKIHLYSEFIPQMFGLIKKDNDLSNPDLLKLRQLLFDKLVLYLEKDNAEKINTIIKGLIEQRTRAPKSFAEIVTILSNDLEQNTSGDVLYSIWNNFAVLKKEVYIDDTIVQNASTGNFWHFCMLGQNQVDYFIKHSKEVQQELSLIEYDECWRTEKMREVKTDDIVFLFQRGGCGYIGVFKVEGLRVFDHTCEDIREYINGKLQNAEQTKEDIIKYDIYKSLDDGATYCSNLIVMPLAFVSEGVCYPGGVYRKTISRYDSTYSRQLLGRFLYMNSIQNDGLEIVAKQCVIENIPDHVAFG